MGGVTSWALELAEHLLAHLPRQVLLTMGEGLEWTAGEQNAHEWAA